MSDSIKTAATWRWRLYELLEDDDIPSPGRRLSDAFLALVIMATVACAILETVPSLDERYHDFFNVIEAIAGIIFTIEYLLRLWVIAEDRAGRYGQGWRGRLRFMATPMALIDLFALLPFFLSFLLPDSLVFLRALRLVRIVKLARYSPALSMFEVVIYNQRAALGAGAMIIGAAVIILSGFAFIAEGETQPEAFGTIPDAMWWTVITMTTVGYGDVTPVTTAGRLIAALTSFLGISMFAFPTAILGAGFAEEMQKRDFSKMASMVANLPAFAHFTTGQIAELTALLHVRELPPRYHVIKRGEHADSMYFIDSGQVVARFQQHSIRLQNGDFFGETALLRGSKRQVTAITLSACRLLELRAGDFHRLIANDPILKDVMAIKDQKHSETLKGQQDRLDD